MGPWLDVRLCAACLRRVLAEGRGAPAAPVARRRRDRAGHESPDGQLRLSAAGGGRAGAERARDAGIETVKSYGPTAPNGKREGRNPKQFATWAWATVGSCPARASADQPRVRGEHAQVGRDAAGLGFHNTHFRIWHTCASLAAGETPCLWCFAKSSCWRCLPRFNRQRRWPRRQPKLCSLWARSQRRRPRQTLPGHESILRSRWIRIAPAALARARDSAAGTMPAKLARPCGRVGSFAGAKLLRRTLLALNLFDDCRV